MGWGGGMGWNMLEALAPPGWDGYLEASPLLSPLLIDALRSNSYPGGKEVSQASCRSIFCNITVRSGKGFPPPPPPLPLYVKPIR